MDAIDVTTLAGRRAVARWERLSVGDVFDRLTWSLPDQEAIVASPGAASTPELERVTYRQADEIASRVATALLARGLKRSDRVLLFCENSVEAILLKVGIAKAGLVCAPVNTMMAPEVIAYLIEQVEPRFAIVDAELWPRAQEAFALTGLNVDVMIELGGPAAGGAVSFTEFVASGTPEEPSVEIHGDDIWQLLFTSGTTAMPKAVMISHTYTHLAGQSMAMSLTRGLLHESRLRMCTFLPLVFHVGDQIFAFATFLAGGTLVLGRRPVPVEVAQAVARERATALWGGAPAMIAGMTEVLDSSPDLDVSTLTMAVYGWACLPPETVAALRRHAGPQLQTMAIFGQTEAISCHRFWPSQHEDLHARTAPLDNYVGVPNPLLAAKIVDADGADIPADQVGVPGEVVYRSPVVTAGYYRDEAATAEAFRDGWFHSGDSLGHGEEGQRVMLDRYKDIVKTGGENVSSLRVEAVLTRHPDVTAAAVVGLAHERWGEAVTAFVVLRPGADQAAMVLTDWARRRLAGYETPKSIIVVEELPTTVGGKVLKHKLRASYASYYEASQDEGER